MLKLIPCFIKKLTLFGSFVETMKKVGTTALIPSEVVYACGFKPIDLNNFVPFSNITPEDKLCAWTAIWRELVLKKHVKIDKLIVVASGDCYNALVDGEKIELSGVETFYFTYPFDGNFFYMKKTLKNLVEFLGGIRDRNLMNEVYKLKKLALEIDKKRVLGKADNSTAFKILVSASDLMGDLESYKKEIENFEEKDVDYEYRVALIGIPPIYRDFHEVLEKLGFLVVYDEMPYEFARLSGRNFDEIARSYVNYTFARNIKFRINFIKNEIEKRKADAVIHFTQFACHHKLEDSIFRRELDFPFLTIEADLPSETPEQIKLRLEAFAERLREFV